MRPVVISLVMMIGLTSARAEDRKTLEAERAELVKKAEKLEHDAGPLPGDSTAVSTVNSTGSEHCESVGGGLEKCTTISSTGSQGGVSAIATSRISMAKFELERVARDIQEIDRKLAALPPDPEAPASQPWTPGVHGIYIDSAPSTTSFWDSVGKELTQTGSYGGYGRVLGEGQRGTSNGIQGNGIAFGLAFDLVTAKHAAGVSISGEAELGYYKQHGAIGSIGIDIGPGLRSRRAFIGVTGGIHETASIYQTARWIPILVHVGLYSAHWGLSFAGGYGWRPDLPKDGSPESMVVNKGPVGTKSSLFKLMIDRGRIQIGLQYQDLDGLRIGSVVLGGGNAGTWK